MHNTPRPSAEIISLFAYRLERDKQNAIAAARNAARQQQQPKPRGGTPILRRRIEW